MCHNDTNYHDFATSTDVGQLKFLNRDFLLQECITEKKYCA